MRVLGLTGGIGSGKSTVARMLRERGYPVLDADAIAREVVLPGTPALAEIVARFGEEMLDDRGELDRRRLGARVFSDEEARRTLNAITHPRIAAETARRLAELAAKGLPTAIYEAALLVENQSAGGLDGLIVVESDPTVRRARIAARDGLDEDEIDRRMASQASDAARRAAADVLLRNDGDLVALEGQVEALHRLLSSGAPWPPPKNGGS